MLDLKMSALGIILHCKWNYNGKSNAFMIKEILAKFVSCIQEDDIGYFYNPSFNKICIQPGELLGEIMNTDLPFDFDIVNAVKTTLSILNSIDKYDYNKLMVILTDDLQEKDIVRLKSVFNRRDPSIKVYLISLNSNNEVDIGDANFLSLSDIINLDNYLDKILQTFK